MRILGLDFPGSGPTDTAVDGTVVALHDDGALATSRRVESLPAATAVVAELAGDDPYTLGVNLPLVAPRKAARNRPVDNLVRRRLGVRLPPGGRGAGQPAGEALMAGLAAAGHPCLPWPDRDRRASGLAETHPALVLRALLWEQGGFASRAEHRDAVFRGLVPPAHRRADRPARSQWPDQAAALGLVLAALGRPEGFDTAAARRALDEADDDESVERAAGLLDALLIAGAARRHLLAPETSLFAGERDDGYVVLPADESIRRMVLGEPAPHRRELFPQASLRDRLGDVATLRQLELLDMPGRPQRTEARFDDPPRFEFDNVDEMLWWKHCRQLGGPRLPTEGLAELLVVLEAGGDDARPLRLARSRHRTLSFRFDRPAAWRSLLPPRDGRTHRFRVVAAVYETRPGHS